MFVEVWGVSSFSCASPTFLFHFRKSRKMFCTVHFDEKMEKMEKNEKVEKDLLFESWVKKFFFANIKKSLLKTGNVESLLKK